MGFGATTTRTELASGGVHRLTEVEGGVADFEWSPDGKRIEAVGADDHHVSAFA